MLRTVRGANADCLERFCGPRSDSIRFGPSAYGVDRAEVYIAERGFEPHRHDTYGIGVTTAGVQIFRYRGSQRVCLPGQLHVLHPDETHDGGPGTEDGFSYRILYIPPELIRGALGGRALPFVADPVQDPKPTARSIVAMLADIDDPISELSCAEIAVTVADCLLSLSDRPDRRPATVDIRAVELVREYLAAHAREQTPASTLEEIAGTDRFTITRHFRWAIRDEPGPLPDDAPPDAGASRNRERTATRASGCRGRFRRSESHDATLQADLWIDPDPVEVAYGRSVFAYLTVIVTRVPPGMS